MSKPRLAAKLRQNSEFPAMTAWLDRIGFAYELVPPKGHGYPHLSIRLPDGRVVQHYINITPKSGGNPRAALSELRRTLRGVGYDLPP